MMKIIYNPKDGAVIKGYIYLGNLIDPHYPDGYEVDGKVQNGMKQYDDELAEAICDNFRFLEELNPNQAKKIIDRPEAEKLKCEDCDFSTTIPVALSGHKRKHKIEKAVFDEAVIPVAGTKQIGNTGMPARTDEDPKAGRDADGVEWYGPGVTIDNKANGFSTVPSEGRGHFVG